MSIFAWSLLFTLATVWGVSFFFNAVILNEFGVLTTVFFRVSIAGIVLAVIYKASKGRFEFRRYWARYLVLGIANNALPFTLIVFAQQHIESGFASVLNSSTPLFGLVLSHFFTRDEKIGISKIFGIGSGIAGGIVLVGAEAFNGFGGSFWGGLLIFVASFSYAVAGILAKRGFKAESSVQTSSGMLLAAAILLLPFTLVIEGVPKTFPSLNTVLAILGFALISTAFAYILYFKLLQVAGVVNLLLVTFLVPVSANILGVLILNEVITWIDASGMALIGLGLIVLDGRLFRLLQKFKHTSG